MPSTLLRLAVALLAFGLGVTATTLWIAYRTPDVQRLEHGTRHVPPLPPLPTIEELPPPPPPAPRLPVNGGVLNVQAISKPQPAYPAIAATARAEGTVNVQIMIDEDGEVISAKAVSGHPLLQQAAVAAAYRARFLPTLLYGQPVKVSGTISYDFVLP
ncbi:MAG TPA: energy transducer TonB [Pyrinomonadaceae bacterium]|jgi:protein TonB|nr:energy transducer TonB [Pyrinomonadaceae bacterium]